MGDTARRLSRDALLSGRVHAAGRPLNPAGADSAGTVGLLKKFADETVGCLGAVSIENVVFNPTVDDIDVGRSVTVYYTATE